MSIGARCGSCARELLLGQLLQSSDGTCPSWYRKQGPSLGLLLHCGCGQQLG
jgi:hypothetical protein